MYFLKLYRLTIFILQNWSRRGIYFCLLEFCFNIEVKHFCVVAAIFVLCFVLSFVCRALTRLLIRTLQEACPHMSYGQYIFLTVSSLGSKSNCKGLFTCHSQKEVFNYCWLVYNFIILLILIDHFDIFFGLLLIIAFIAVNVRKTKKKASFFSL